MDISTPHVDNSGLIKDHSSGSCDTSPGHQGDKITGGSNPSLRVLFCNVST